MKDLVSIIIPVYNRQETVGECIDSIFVQSYQNFEIVLIDDGSTDKTVELCEEFAKKDERIKLIKADHGGVSAARNKGIDACIGEYVFFVDSDDVIHPRLIEVLVRELNNSDASIAGTGRRNVPEDSWYKVKEKMPHDFDSPEIIYHDNAETMKLVFSEATPFSVMGGVIMRRDLIGDTRFNTELFIGEDFYFIYENLIKGANSIFLLSKVYYGRLDSKNSSWNYSFNAFWSRFYRRVLVWRKEEQLNRHDNAALQKRDAFGCFMRCFFKHEPHSDDGKKMLGVLKEYKKEILPALGFKTKVLYSMCLYFPGIASLLYNLKNNSTKAPTKKRNVINFHEQIKIESKHIETISRFLNMSLDSGDEIFETFAALPGAVFEKGKEPLQRYVYVPGTRSDRIVLVAHSDTIWDKSYSAEKCGQAKAEYKDGVFYSSNADCGIGADDRAGCAMLWELRDSGHSILIVDGEEKGKHGARYLKKSNPKLYRELNRHCFMLELDWRGTNYCLYNQVDNTEKFKDYILENAGFEEENAKGGCDLQILCKSICGANVGVGYHNFHTPKETLDVYEWENTLCKLTEFLMKPQFRFKSKFFPRYFRLAQRAIGKMLRILKLKK